MEPRDLVCVECLKKFVFIPKQSSDESPRYCKKKCRDRTSAKRSKALKQAIEKNAPLCPTPHKKWYRSWQEADRAANEVNSYAPGLRSYRCSCGSFHIGHGVAAKKRRKS